MRVQAYSIHTTTIQLVARQLALHMHEADA